MEIRTLHDVAASVRGRRVGLRLTQQTLATRAGVSRSFVSDLEAGKPTVELRRVIAVLEALGYSLDLETAERAQAFRAASRLLAEATSFGGVHSTGERRARWGGDDVSPGLVRLSIGLEDVRDLVADLEAALDAARG